MRLTENLWRRQIFREIEPLNQEPAQRSTSDPRKLVMCVSHWRKCCTLIVTQSLFLPYEVFQCTRAIFGIWCIVNTFTKIFLYFGVSRLFILLLKYFCSLVYQGYLWALSGWSEGGLPPPIPQPSNRGQTRHGSILYFYTFCVFQEKIFPNKIIFVKCVIFARVCFKRVRPIPQARGSRLC